MARWTGPESKWSGGLAHWVAGDRALKSLASISFATSAAGSFNIFGWRQMEGMRNGKMSCNRFAGRRLVLSTLE